MPDHAQQFSDEEKAHLNYFGSMLRVGPNSEEEEQQRIFDAFDRAGEQGMFPPRFFIGTPSQA